MALANEQRIVAKPDVLSRILDGEAVLLDMESGTYFGLNEVASEMWRLITDSAAAGVTAKSICDAVVESFEVDEITVAQDLEALVSQLVDHGLVDLPSDK